MERKSPLWLSTLSAFSVVFMLISAFFLLKDAMGDWRFLLLIPCYVFSGIVGAGIGTMIKEKTIY